MSTQQDIYAVSSESRPPMLNKEKYVPWLSRLLCYAKSRPNGKLIHNFIINGPYFRRMIPGPEKKLKQIEADDQAIQTILLGLPKDIYAAFDSCETAQEIWLRPEWSRHVTIVHQTKDLHTANYTQLYDFLKYNQKEVDELKAERLAKIQDPLALMENSNNPYAFLAPHQDQPSFNQNYMQQTMPNPKDITDPATAMNMALALMAEAFKLNYSTPTNNNQRISSNPHNRQIAQPGINMGQDRQIQMVGGNGENYFRQYAGQNVGNLNGYNAIQNVRNQIRCYNCRGVDHFARNYTVRPRRRDAAYLQTQIFIAQKEEARIQLQAEEFDLMAAAADLDEIEEVNANCILMANLHQASTSGTQTDKAPVYDSDGSARVHDYENCDDNEIFNMFTQEEQYTELFEPIPDQHQVPQNDNNVISEVTSMEQSRETVEQHPANFEETHDTTPSVARKFLNEVKSTIVTLQRVVKHRMTVETHNWSSSAHQELHKIVKDENFPFVNQVDTRVQNFEIQFLKEAAKFVGDFKSLAKEADESLAKHKALELEIKRLLRAVVSQDIMFVMQKTSVVDTLNLQTELERTKERFENCIIKKENEYAKLWNDWYKSLGDLKGKSKDTSCVSDTLNPLSRKLENANVELEFQALNYARENAHLKATYKNLFDSIFVSRTQTKTIIASLQNELKNTIYENANLRAQLFNKVSGQKDNKRGTSKNTKFAKQSILGKPPMLDEIHALLKPVTSNLDPTPQESKVMKNDKVIALGMFRINPFKTSREEKHVHNNVRTSTRTKPITVSQPSVIPKKDMNFDSNGFSSTRIDNTKTRRPQPRSNTKNDKVPSASNNSQSKNKGAEVEEHHRNLLLSKNKKHMSSACNIFTLDSQNVYSKDSRGKKQTTNVSIKEKQKKQKPKVKKPKKVGFIERLATPKPSKPRSLLRWSPIRRMFDLNGNIIASSESESQSDCFKGDNACTSNPVEPTIKRFLNSTFSLAEAARTMLIFSRAPLFLWAEAIATVCFTQNSSIIHRHFNKTPYELINGRKPDISFLHVFGALCYPKNDREDIGKLGAKGDIGFFIGYSADSCAYIIYNRKTKKIIETMNVLFDELSAMAFEQRSSKPRLQSMTSRQISSGLDLTYAPSTITTQQPTEGELDLLFEAIYMMITLVVNRQLLQELFGLLKNLKFVKRQRHLQ
nr:hypothetical protein [Tanacetum cinerariifolium]